MHHFLSLTQPFSLRPHPSPSITACLARKTNCSFSNWKVVLQASIQTQVKQQGPQQPLGCRLFPTADEMRRAAAGLGVAAPTSCTQHLEAFVHPPVVAPEDSTFHTQCSETDLATYGTHCHITSLLLNRLSRLAYHHLPGTSSLPFNCKVISQSPQRELFPTLYLSPKISGVFPSAHPQHNWPADSM